ncbi:hypothetical protein BOTBODRAFT_26195 [Botryobasidium botryosum FD-172 SS1]|uniref:PHD-type domain-containing protein n=1 Tax=Botryobasidium botryosum (strain FD-172 SS1) TaxID=930990 RepID=A0A067N1N8_BOTB1|nr:hypothetical protein BOTBODRAFT_26195 [Botryobasidium botryosum FD-172 SS1]
MPPREPGSRSTRSVRARAPPSTTHSKTSTSPTDEHPNGTSTRNRRVKEEPDDASHLQPEEKTGRGKRNKGKQKAVEIEEELVPAELETPAEADGEEEETRCVCGRNDEDIGMMIQCDTCKVWQHGSCVGIMDEVDCPETYFCERCRPDLHATLLKSLHKSSRQSTRDRSPSLSAQPMNSTGTSHRASRSHSPNQKHKSPKRRNTMNSRDAAYYDTKAALSASKSEADHEELPAEPEVVNPRRKRKRVTDVGLDSNENAKRKRSLDTPEPKNTESLNGGETSRPLTNGKASANIDAQKLEPAPAARSRQRARKEPAVDGEGKAKHPNQYTYRNKPATSARRNNNGAHDQPTRRNGGSSRPNAASPSPVPLSWNLPDHISHLAPLLPTPSPRGVEVRLGPSLERALERGVRVRWPGKRMTIGEMRRRVRGMMEFVAKAQVETAEREKRVRELRRAMGLEWEGPFQPLPEVDPEPDPKVGEDGDKMVVDGVGGVTASPLPNGDIPLPNGINHSTITQPHKMSLEANHMSIPVPTTRMSTNSSTSSSSSSAVPSLVTTTQLLDELTRELIQFQERFGAGKEGQKLYRERSERERRTRGVVDRGEVD